MKLKSLEVNGFKSFVDRLHLSFRRDHDDCGPMVAESRMSLTPCSGHWERSAKHLRGKLMEDVIFNGQMVENLWDGRGEFDFLQ